MTGGAPVMRTTLSGMPRGCLSWGETVMAALESSAKLRMVAPPLPMIAPHSGVGTSSRSIVLFPSRASMDSATACAHGAPAVSTACSHRLAPSQGARCAPRDLLWPACTLLLYFKAHISILLAGSGLLPTLQQAASRCNHLKHKKSFIHLFIATGLLYRCRRLSMLEYPQGRAG